MASSQTVRLIFKIIFASSLMGTAIFMLNPIAASWVEFSLITKIFELAQLITIGATVFAISLLVLGVRKSTFSGAQVVSK